MAKWLVWKDDYDGEAKWCLLHHSLYRIYKFDEWKDAHDYINSYEASGDVLWQRHLQQTAARQEWNT